jgi:hypothetical protein
MMGFAIFVEVAAIAFVCVAIGAGITGLLVWLL